MNNPYSALVRRVLACWLIGGLSLLLNAPTCAQAAGPEGLVADVTELEVLRQFYDAYGGPAWTTRTNWTQGTTLAEAATWYGVTVAGGDVTGLALPANNLRPVPYPPYLLYQLLGLQLLDLSGNAVDVTLLYGLRNLPNLQELNLSGCLSSLSLDFVSLGTCPNLRVVRLHNTRLYSARIGAAVGRLQRLEVLDLGNDDNFVNGQAVSGPLPSELGNCRALRELNLARTYVEGALPASIGRLTQLEVLDVSYAALDAPLPDSLGYCRALRVLALPGQNYGSGIGGDLRSLRRLTNLERVDLSRDGLGAAVPAELANNAALAELRLGQNRLTGSVPAALGNLPQLAVVDLSYNQLTQVPSFLAGPNRAALRLAVPGNALDFGSLKPNFTGVGTHPFAAFAYSPQASPSGTDVVEILEGNTQTLTRTMGGTQNRYQWERLRSGAWAEITGATGASYQVVDADNSYAGQYRVRVTNDWVPNLTLFTRSLDVRIRPAQSDPPPPPSDPGDDLNRNWTLGRTFDADGNVIGESKQFADGLGRPTQQQVKNLAKRHVLATQTIYNTAGKGVLSTLVAPTNNQEFKYKTNFVTAGGQPYQPRNFEGAAADNPDRVDNTEVGTLGHYYSPNNAWEPATATTTHPYNLTDPYEDPIGGTRRAAGPGDELRMGKKHETRARQFSLLNELDHHSQLRDNFVPGSPTPSLRSRGFKSVTIDPNGIETLSFSNQEGQLLATCLSGDQYPASTLTFAVDSDPATATPQYQEIHVPASTASVTTITPLTSTSSASHFLRVVDTETGAVTQHLGLDPITLSPGFYRFEEYNGSVSFAYQVRYGEFSYVFYNDRDAVPNFVTYNLYSSNGTLLSTRNADEGLVQFVYREDGALRFSQNAVQLRENKFSYINYDRLGRVVESGEYQVPSAGAGALFEPHSVTVLASNSVLQENLLENRDRNGGLDPAHCSQRRSTWYDRPFQNTQLGNRSQEFITGTVAKTANGATTAWYSYDELGRLVWMVQEAPAVGIKTVDYRYDFAGNVLEAVYQQGQPDAFYHHYGYDADQRLRTVHTSSDGQTKTLQARYFYYLHGPLKRTELANKLQGVDYTYTVQGWLKGINHANRSLDPGADQPARNGVHKDLFGLTLDYFNGDYTSRQVAVPTPSVSAATTRYDGSVRSAAWSTVAHADIHLNAYRYDAKNQLLESEFGTLNPATQAFQPAANNGYGEGTLQYDFNGNLQRLRRHDGTGLVTDDFAYQYSSGTNQLAAVNGPTGAAVLDYDYDTTGQLIRQRDEKGPSYLTYDVAGRVTGVYRDEQHQQPRVTFVYDDRGFRASKASYDAGQLRRTTYYVRDLVGNVLSTYEQEAGGSPVLRTEVPLYGAGRVGTLTRQADGTDDARYELNDQLGNARVVFHRPTTTTYLATMAPDQASREEQDFANVATTRFATPLANDGYAARLSAAQGLRQGPGKTLTVAKGDTVTLWAAAFFHADGSLSPTVRVVPLLMAGTIATPPAAAAQETTPARRSWLGRLTAGVALTGWAALRQPLPPTTGVLAYLRYQLKDAQGKVLDEQYEPVDPAAPGAWQPLQLGVRAPEAGTLELSVVSDDPARAVYFDDIKVEHTGGLIVQEQHQYAYGAPLPGLSYVVGDQRYRHGYQGQFAEQDSETGWDSFDERMYSSRIGRWLSVDKVKRFASPYVGMGNNPVLHGDPDGKDVIVLLAPLAAGKMGHSALLVSERNAKGEITGWRYYSKGGGKSGYSGGTVGHGTSRGENVLSLEAFYKTYGLNEDGSVQFTNALYIPTDPRYDNAVREAALAQIGKNYHVMRDLFGDGQSCIDVATDGLEAAGLFGGELPVGLTDIPNIRYVMISYNSGAVDVSQELFKINTRGNIDRISPSFLGAALNIMSSHLLRTGTGVVKGLRTSPFKMTVPKGLQGL